MKRYGSVIGLKPEAVAEYKRLHAAVWPEVLRQIEQSGRVRDQRAVAGNHLLGIRGASAEQP